MFPEGLFYILSRKHGFALDVYDGQTSEGSNLIVWPQKFEDSDNQLWSFEGNRLVNKKSGHVMDISSSAFKKDKTIVQKKRKPSKQSQEWIYDQGFICSKEYPSLVLDIRGDSPKGGAQVLLYKRKDTDNLNQLWQFEQYQQFEGSLGLVTTATALHKKESFGQPRLGYAAEIGVPPELKTIPENNKIAGVGKNTSATPTTNGPVDNSRIDPALAQYGSFYGGTPTSASGAQPGPQPSANAYPPPSGAPPSQSNSVYPPPHAQAGPVPSNNNYPSPPSPSAGYSSPSNNNAYPPPPGHSHAQGPSFPGQSTGGYPIQPPSPSNYQQPSNGGFSSGYPPSSNMNTSYPPPAPPSPSNYMNNSGYGSPPPSHATFPGSPQMAGSPPAYPPSFPSAGNAYPPSNAYPPTHHTGANIYPPHGGMPDNNTYGYPAPPNNSVGPPPLPNNRPQEPYGYPSYPQ